uniref:Uncharacterized protein n=1 Tax=Pyxicephalus adspersus TaxID=30357 RepID=A0AAV3AYH0_PYXAD|nr:TPA: hypothetical protein GDO54_008300 [Pyxicephalus adspersus]
MAIVLFFCFSFYNIAQYYPACNDFQYVANLGYYGHCVSIAEQRAIFFCFNVVVYFVPHFCLFYIFLYVRVSLFEKKSKHFTTSSWRIARADCHTFWFICFFLGGRTLGC